MAELAYLILAVRTQVVEEAVEYLLVNKALLLLAVVGTVLLQEQELTLLLILVVEEAEQAAGVLQVVEVAVQVLLLFVIQRVR
jgi:hypothetical protein